MRHIKLALLLGAAALLPSIASAQSQPVYDPSSLVFGQTQLSSRHTACIWVQPAGGDYTLYDSDKNPSTGATRVCLPAVVSVAADGKSVNAGGGGGGGGAAVTATALAPSRTEGASSLPFSSDLFGAVRMGWWYNGVAVNPSDPVLVTGTGTVGAPSSGLFSVQGHFADKSAQASTNLLMAGCRYRASRPSMNDTEVLACPVDQRGNLPMSIWSGANANPNVGFQSDLTFPGQTAYYFGSVPSLYSGSDLDQQVSMEATTAIATGKGVTAVAQSPTSAVAQGVVPTVNTSNAALGSRVLCSAACNVFHVAFTAGSSAGFLLLVNLTADPADGTLAAAPLVCVPVAANGRVEINRQEVPIRASVGATAIFSTGASCVADTTATSTAMGWFEASVKQ